MIKAMVPVPSEHGPQVDVIFVIEGTAVNGAYLNDLKTNYLIPTVEYFSQGTIEDREYVSENSTTLYGIVVYHAADCLPSPTTTTRGPFSNPHKLLSSLERLEMVGGKGESHANIGEGLATALLCFEDLQIKREPTTNSQKHCILVCNSPPYQTVVQESHKFAGHTVENLAAVFQERDIILSILSPRKIPALFKLFEKAGGDLQTSQTKNYAKDPRHLVLLRNYNLKERPVSPPIGGPVHQTGASAAQIPLSPLQSHDSPNTNQSGQALSQTTQSQTPLNPAFRSQAPATLNSHQSVAPPIGPINPGRPVFNPQLPGPPNYHAARAAQPRWKGQFIPPGGGAVQNNNQGSALIAQLTQPPSSLGLNIQFNQRMDANGAVMSNQQGQGSNQANQSPIAGGNPSQGQGQAQGQAQQTPPQGAQGQEQNQGMQTMNQPPPGQNQAVSSSVMSQTISSQGQQSVAGNLPPAVSSAQQMSHQGQNVGGIQQVSQIGPPGRERPTIWHGILEWSEKARNPTDPQKQTRQVPCHVSANTKDGEPELKADSWPPKVLLQLVPKLLIGNIGGAYLKNSKSVLFHPTPCEALDSLTKVMSAGFAGCVHFPSSPSLPNCDIKVLILLYTAEKRAYLGFIPNDQSGFVERLRKVIQHQKNNQALLRQNQGGAGPPGNNVPGTLPGTSPISQGGILMSQTNTIAMGGGQITQNVVPTNNPQQGLANSTPQNQIIHIQSGGMQQQQQQPSGGVQGMMVQQRPNFDGMDMARQQNLMKIHQLRQTLEAAQQQEAHYQTQLDTQQNLEAAQQQEMQYKLQMEIQQAQKALSANSGIIGQQANTQRMMRPAMTNNLGLRNLLQQQQPQQYRQQVLGMPQQMVGPRGQMGTRPMAPTNQQNQQFDDVTNYDFMP
ncbi:mediator of RNA polymerase II transcription subunit 25 isoform X2 [Diachasma alloeum]|uniref:mediator of RNA polymerase II transcription subunit 25 isoform X2 n=1 Tax=Diachasma alloeum TaxID=454923 RepID=UPI0007382687|nr:mediator of RNA polymerase II transcription subunit 25 isoform X2 [Diachasma alloeum]